MNNWIKEVKQALLMEQVPKALELMFKHNKNKQKEDTLFLLSARWNRVRNKEEGGLISLENSNLERNQIVASLKSVFNDLERDTQTQEASQQSDPAPTHVTHNHTYINGDGNIVVQDVEGKDVTMIMREKKAKEE